MPAPAALSAMFLRNTSSTVYLSAPQLQVGTESVQSGDTTEQAIRFYAEGAPAQSVDVSAGLAPGTYSTSRIPGHADALLDSPLNTCGGYETGTLTVTTSRYDQDGLPVEFDASFDIDSCDSLPASHGELRWNSTTSLSATTSTSTNTIPDPVTVNDVATLPVVLTATGNAPATMGAARLTQHSRNDGTTPWSIAADGCDGHTLAPGESCTVTLRYAPIRPNGTPYGTDAAAIDVPDGATIDAHVPVDARVVALSMQPVGLQARGGFRHVTLTWGAPQAGWDPRSATDYSVYQVMPGGSRRLVASVHIRLGAAGNLARLPGLPDNYRSTYVVRASQPSANTGFGPESVPSTTTTATSELIAPVYDTMSTDQRLAPDTEPMPQDQLAGPGLGYVYNAGDLAVSADQSELAWADTDWHTDPLTYSQVVTTSLDDSPGADFRSAGTGTAQWDVEPTLASDGRTVVYTHSSAPDQPTVLRMASTRTGSTPRDIAGSAGLSAAAFTPDGKALVAVAQDNAGTRLVRLDLTTHAVTPIAGTDGLSAPAVAADGRIVALEDTHLVLLAAGGGTPQPLAQVDAGPDTRPVFSADGATVFFAHTDARGNDDGNATTGGYALDLATAALTMVSSQLPARTPFILRADGTHSADVTAPTAHVTAPAVSLKSATAISWSATDPVVSHAVTSGTWDYDVRYRSSALGSALGAYQYPAAWQHSSATTAARTTSPGRRYCFSVRARDSAGNVSRWSAESCTSTPIDDRGLRTSAVRVSDRHAYATTLSTARRTGTRFVRAGVTARRIELIVTTCATCGSVQVRLGGVLLGTVHTASTKHTYQVVRTMSVPAARSGTLVLTTTSARPVSIDGVLPLP